MTNVQSHPLSPFPSHQLRSQVNPRASQAEETVQVQTQANLNQKDRWGKKGACSVTESPVVGQEKQAMKTSYFIYGKLIQHATSLYCHFSKH